MTYKNTLLVYYSSGCAHLQWLKSRCQQGPVTFGIYVREALLCLRQLPETTCVPRLLASFSIFKARTLSHCSAAISWFCHVLFFPHWKILATVSSLPGTFRSSLPGTLRPVCPSGSVGSHSLSHQQLYFFFASSWGQDVDLSGGHYSAYLSLVWESFQTTEVRVK